MKFNHFNDLDYIFDPGSIEYNEMSEELIQKMIRVAWEHGTIIPGFDPEIYRQDIFGAWMQKDLFGKKGVNLSKGWMVDFCRPYGSDTLFLEVRPLQWENKESIDDGFVGSAVSSVSFENKYLK